MHSKFPLCLALVLLKVGPVFAANGMFPKMPAATNAYLVNIHKDSGDAWMTAIDGNESVAEVLVAKGADSPSGWVQGDSFDVTSWRHGTIVSSALQRGSILISEPLVRISEGIFVEFERLARRRIVPTLGFQNANQRSYSCERFIEHEQVTTGGRDRSRIFDQQLPVAE